VQVQKGAAHPIDTTGGQMDWLSMIVRCTTPDA
jgi:hypothetical protein